MLGTAGISVAVVGVVLVMLAWWRGRHLRWLARSYPLRRMRDLEAGDAARIRGRVVKGQVPRWREPVKGEPVVLSRLVVHNSAKVVIDITRGERFELADDEGTRAEIHIVGAVIERTMEFVSLPWPAQSEVQGFFTPKSMTILGELARYGNPDGKATSIQAELVAICPGDEIEVCSVARRDASKPKAAGYRETRGMLTLGGVGEAPVRVVKLSIEALVAQYRKLRRAGYLVTCVGLALMALYFLFVSWS